MTVSVLFKVAFVEGTQSGGDLCSPHGQARAGDRERLVRDDCLEMAARAAAGTTSVSSTEAHELQQAPSISGPDKGIVGYSCSSSPCLSIITLVKVGQSRGGLGQQIGPGISSTPAHSTSSFPPGVTGDTNFVGGTSPYFGQPKSIIVLH